MTTTVIFDLIATFFGVVMNLLCWRWCGAFLHHYVGRFQPLAVEIASRLIAMWGCIVAVTLALGFIGVLSPIAIYLFVSLIWFFLGRRPTSKHADLLDNLTISSRWSTVGWGVLIAIGLSHVIKNGLLTLPHDWDTLAYHLPIVDAWIQTGSLASDQIAFWYVPGNNEILALWLTGLLSGDYLAQLNNVPVVVLLVTSCLGILNHFRVVGTLRFFFVVGILGNSPVFRQLVSAENDVAVGALIASALLFAIKYCQEVFETEEHCIHVAIDRAIEKSLRRNSTASNSYLFLFAVSVGLLGGVKYYALGYVAVITGILLGVEARYGLIRFFRVEGSFSNKLETSRFLRRPIRIFLVLAASVSVFAFPWYARNFYLTGSPVYPKGFELLGIADAWKTRRPDLHSSMLLFGTDLEVLRLLSWAWIAQAGAWLTFCIAAFPVLAISTVLARLLCLFFRSQPATNFAGGYGLLAWVAAGACFVYLITPNVIETLVGSRNMLKAQYHPVRFGFATATVASLWITVSLSSWLRRLDASLSDARLGHTRRRFGTFIPIAIQLGVGLACVASFVWNTAPNFGLHFTSRIFYVNLGKPGRLLSTASDSLLALAASVLLVCLLNEFRKSLGRPTMTASVLLLIVLGTPILGWYWHSNYRGHFAQFFYGSFEEKLHTQLRTIAGTSQLICVCDYRCYPLMGSRRETNIWRPLFLHSSDWLRDEFETRNVLLVLVPTSDTHASKAYAKAFKWMREDFADEFELVESDGLRNLFRRIDVDSRDAVQCKERQSE